MYKILKRNFKNFLEWYDTIESRRFRRLAYLRYEAFLLDCLWDLSKTHKFKHRTKARKVCVEACNILDRRKHVTDERRINPSAEK